METPAYPFFTRFGTHPEDAQFAAWFSDKVVLRVYRPCAYEQKARIEWEHDRHSSDVPRWANPAAPAAVDVLVSRDEFMAAYAAAEAFLQAAARELLPPVAVQYATSSQVAVIKALIQHPAFTRPARTQWRLKVNRLTKDAADAAIKALTDTRAMFDQVEPAVGAYAVQGEAYRVNAA